MARRARRGLADLSDSEEDECSNKTTSCVKENCVSLFDTKVYSENVLNKIQEEEAKVMSFEGIKNVTVSNSCVVY